MPAMDKATSVRMAALDFAARLGLPHEMTLKAARAYLAFLEGKEAAGWSAESVWQPLSASLLKDAQASLNKLKTKRAAGKKPVTFVRRAKAA